MPRPRECVRLVDHREADRDEREDLASIRSRQDSGELAGNLDPAAALLAVMGMVAAPVALPGMVPRRRYSPAALRDRNDAEGL